MNHALTHLREELRRLKQIEIEIKNDCDRERREYQKWRDERRQNWTEQEEVVKAIRVLETAAGLHRGRT